MELYNSFEIWNFNSINRIDNSRLSVNNFEDSTRSNLAFGNFFQGRRQLTYVKSNNDDTEEDCEHNTGSILLPCYERRASICDIYTMSSIPETQRIGCEHSKEGSTYANSSENSVFDRSLTSLYQTFII